MRNRIKIKIYMNLYLRSNIQVKQDPPGLFVRLSKRPKIYIKILKNTFKELYLYGNKIPIK